MVLSLVAAACGPSENDPDLPPASLALINGRLIDGTGSDPVDDAVVVIDGERIVAAGPEDEVSIPGDTPTVDLQGATVLPGFINTHVHGAYDDERLAAWAQSGVTTVRDLGSWVVPGSSPLPPAHTEA